MSGVGWSRVVYTSVRYYPQIFPPLLPNLIAPVGGSLDSERRSRRSHVYTSVIHLVRGFPGSSHTRQQFVDSTIRSFSPDYLFPELPRKLPHQLDDGSHARVSSLPQG